jgi:hypothetical protein
LDDFLNQGWGDWVSPSLRAWELLAYGPGVRLAIPLSGVSARDVQAHLRARGVRTWGVFLDGQVMFARVKKGQARWARAVLLRAGIRAL